MELSEAGIASAALIHLGRDPIADLDASEDPNAGIMRARMPVVRDRVLRSYPWNFAMYFASIPATALAAPMFGFTHSCVLPSGGAHPYCLALRKVDTSANFAVRGRALFTSAAGPFDINYIGRNENYEEYDPIAAELLAIELALAVINKIPSSDIRKTRRELTAERRTLRRSGTLIDAAEATPKEQGGGSKGSWLDARRPL